MQLASSPPEDHHQCIRQRRRLWRTGLTLQHCLWHTGLTLHQMQTLPVRPCRQLTWGCLGRTLTRVRCAVQLADMVAARAQQGKNYGVVLVPEGLIECVPEVRFCPAGR